jgi:MFS family permease
MSVNTEVQSNTLQGEDISSGEKVVVPSNHSTDDLIEPEFDPDYHFYLAFSALAVVTLAAALDATTLSVALPIIAADLGGSAIEAFWAGTSFLLTSTVFQPSYASFSHIFGRKPMVFIALTFFAIGAIIAGVSKNFTELLVGRSLQGVGAGGIISLTEIIITDMVPLRVRGKWFGFMSGMWAIGSVTGPIVGGAFAQNGTILHNLTIYSC